MTDASTPFLVTIIDDDADVRCAVGSLLRSIGYRVIAFASAEEFLACHEAASASCLMLDIHLDGADGLEVQQALHDCSIAVPVVLMTGQGDIPMTVRGMKAGAVDFLTKPFVERKRCSGPTFQRKQGGASLPDRMIGRTVCVYARPYA